MTKLGIIFMPRSARLSLEVARTAEEGGFWGLGICDSPILYSEMYPVITACLLNTHRIVIGPNVTNPVSRHWTVHAASSRTLEEIVPGRYFLGIASGDGAVYSVGMRPAKAAALEESINNIRSASSPATPVQVAAGGPRIAEVAGRSGSGMITGTGTDVEAVRFLRQRALAARHEAGNDEPFEVWALALLNVVESKDQVEAARREIQPVAVAYGRHAFDFTFEGKNVPEEYQALMRERFPRYDFMEHARVTGDENPNALLFEDHPEVESYLVDRFAIVGTPDMCLERLEGLISQTGIDGVWMPTTVRDPVRDVQLAAKAFSPILQA